MDWADDDLRGTLKIELRPTNTTRASFLNIRFAIIKRVRNCRVRVGTVWIAASTLDTEHQRFKVDFEIFASECVHWKCLAPGIAQCRDGVDGGWVPDAGRWVAAKNEDGLLWPADPRKWWRGESRR